MEEFTFPSAVLPEAGQCKLLPAFPHPHQLGLGSPPRWLVDGGEEDEEQMKEKMDMLWEDFNEELTRAPPVCPLSPLHRPAGELVAMMMMKEAWLDGGTRSEAEKRNAGSVVRRRRRWSLLLMLRLLKKLFLANKSNPRTAPL